MNETTTVRTMTLDGGEACLDFINSGYDREPGKITERLNTYEDLIILAERLELFDKSTLENLEKMATTKKGDAENALSTGWVARTLLYRLFEHLAKQNAEPLPAEDMKTLNELFTQARKNQVLALNGFHPEFRFDAAAAGLLAPVWKIVLSAYDLLKSGNLQYIRQCDGCAWLFLDSTKNHRKKWCSMESCGNSQKTRRYYAKKKLHA